MAAVYTDYQKKRLSENGARIAALTDEEWCKEWDSMMKVAKNKIVRNKILKDLEKKGALK